MGQYWKAVNLDKREFINPHKLGAGLKLWEQLANAPGTGAALVILCAAMPEPRGGGDLDMEENWHGPERRVPGRDNTRPGPMPDDCPKVAKRTHRTVGRRPDRARRRLRRGLRPPGRVQGQHHIYGRCYAKDEREKGAKGPFFEDITDDVARVIEHELNGKYEGEGWREWKPEGRRSL